MADKLTFYRSGVKRDWRWRLQDGGNGRKLANAGEGYKNLGDAMSNAFYVLNIISAKPKHQYETAVERATGEHLLVLFRNSK